MSLGLFFAGCGDEGISPEALRFGQSGEVQVQVITPLLLGTGQLRQLILWRSSGGWQLFESLSYRGLTGDETRRTSPGDAALYAELIALVNETPGLKLFIDELDASLVPPCDSVTSTVILRIYDEPRDETREWHRCGRGPLTVLTPEGAGPDPAASRVLNAVQLVRDRTIGVSAPFLSGYHGSFPFGTLDRGSDSRSGLRSSTVFVAEEGAGPASHEPARWSEFWRAHTGKTDPPPRVDWAREMVLYVSYGERHEAGDSLEVRRVLPVVDGTLIEVFETVPGDFCAPAARTHVPFHIVVAPLARMPLRFSDLRIERIRCGA
ncbi:MAG: hypothetical protein HY704_03300 [Gemmatimonadetes bacterium]|nr:hypothetical protein [Gemmatimonadota bacterium]